MGLSQDQLVFFCFFLPSVAALKWSRRGSTFGLLEFTRRLTLLPIFYELVCTCWKSGQGNIGMWKLDEDIKRRQEVWKADRKKGPGFTAPALRGSFEMEKAERTRRERGGRGGVEPTA